ncbi:hypothetical protein N9068_01155, partial [bacterium]|nr:hypothetical protein [bacterium]
LGAGSCVPGFVCGVPAGSDVWSIGSMAGFVSDSGSAEMTVRGMTVRGMTVEGVFSWVVFWMAFGCSGAKEFGSMVGLHPTKAKQKTLETNMACQIK